MRKELAEDCQRCDARPACELAGQQYVQLEKAAAALGFTVTEGSVTCTGRVPGSMLLDLGPRCDARLSEPALASVEERGRIAELANLDEAVKSILPSTQAIVEALRSY